MKYIKIFFVFGYLVIILSAVVLTPLTVSDSIYAIALCESDNEDFIPKYEINKEENILIAIDPGHGGIDTGAQYIIDEVELINKTSEALFLLLSEDENFTPIYTKDFNKDASIDDRVNFINEEKPSLVISIHANSDFAKSTNGFECYPTVPGRLYHEESLAFAQLIVKYMQESGHKIRGETGIKYAYYSNGNKKIVHSSDDTVRSLKSFGIVEKVNCPSVLVEQGFISSYEDVENWAGDEGAKKAATVYYEAIKEYFNKS